MRRTVGALAAAGMVAACGGEAGIVAEIKIDGENYALDVDSLRYAVAVFTGPDQYRSDDESLGAAVRVGDLHVDPFRLFVRDEIAVEAAVMVVAVGYDEDPTTPVAAGRFAMPFPFVDGEVRLYELFLEPIEQTNIVLVSETCVTWVDQRGRRLAAGIPPDDDLDCDGAINGVDCDPMDANLGAPAPEECNGRDDDCDGACDDGFDVDMDGWTQCGSLMPGGGCAIDTVNFDCDDNRPGVFPGNPAGEGAVCDGLDNDCNGTCDDPFDTDGDGVPFCATAQAAPGCEVDCAPDVESVYMGASVPCYRGGAECFTGVTTCLRSADGWGLAACDPGSSDQPVPPSLCSAYQACVGLPIWATCWEQVNMSESMYWACSWPVKNDGTPCPGSASLFALDAAMGNCTFEHVHATEDSVSITFSEPTECAAELQVTSVETPLADDWITFMVSQEPALFEARFVIVMPSTVETCPSEIPPCVLMP